MILHSAFEHWQQVAAGMSQSLKLLIAKGLNAEFLTELACRDDQLSPEALINMSILLQ